MNKPNFRDNLRELAKIAKALLVIGLVVINIFVLILLHGIITAEPTASQKMRDPDCNFLPAATVLVGEHSVIVPALDHTSIWFAGGQVPDHSYVSAVWGGDSIGFCEAFFPENAKARSVVFRGHEVKIIARELGLPSFEEVSQLSIGTRGMGTWLSSPDGAVQTQNPDILLKDDTGSSVYEDGLPWVTYYHSAGHLEGGLRVSAKCIGFRHTSTIECGLRITRVVDGMVFDVRVIKLEELPQDNQKMPQTFALVAERLPLLLEYLQQDRPL